MSNRKPTLPASNPKQPSASKFYHFARERRDSMQPLSHETATGAGAPVRQAPKATARGDKRGRQVDIREELARRERIKNDDAEQDIILKRKTLNRLFWFLTLETMAIFALAILQGFEVLRLEEWSFKLLTTATIAQITAMLIVAVRHLFPTKQ